jgi:hypothetical protein
VFEELQKERLVSALQDVASHEHNGVAVDETVEVATEAVGAVELQMTHSSSLV